MKAGDIAFGQVWLVGALGSTLGDWLSYWTGAKFKKSIARIWPFSRCPNLFAVRGKVITQTDKKVGGSKIFHSSLVSELTVTVSSRYILHHSPSEGDLVATEANRGSHPPSGHFAPVGYSRLERAAQCFSHLLYLVPVLIIVATLVLITTVRSIPTNNWYNTRPAICSL
jgi:hypothetical protein